MRHESTGKVSGAPPRHLRADGLDHRWDVDADAPLRLTWRASEPGQVAYRVAATTSDDVPVWDSGRVVSAVSSADLPARTLSDAQRYRWKVRVWVTSDTASAWSEAAELGTGPGRHWQHSVPVWPPPPVVSEAEWSDYDLTVTLTQGTPRPRDAGPLVGAGMDIPGAHRLGLVFRSRDLQSGYVWTLDAEGGSLVAAVRRDGQLFELDRVAIPQIPPGTMFNVTVSVRGSEIVTSLNGRYVHSLADASWSSGGFGLSSPDDARCVVHRLRATTASGTVLVDDDFADGTTVLGVGSAAHGELQVAERSNGLYPAGNEWAFLRDDRSLDRPVRWATLFATASSPEPARQFVYRVFVNGTEVGQGPARSVGDETRYDGFDVTHLLRPGTNTIAALAWTPSDQRFQAELVATFNDGEQLVWGTSGAWSALSDPTVYPTVGSIGTGYYAAPVENLQLARFPVGFAEPGFDDSEWARAVERAPFAQLLPTPTAKVQVREYRPANVRRLGPDRVLLDFGRTHVGGVRIRGSIPHDCHVELRFAELLDASGRARFQLAAGNMYLDRWSLPAGDVDAATWGLRVFRYVEIQGLSAETVALLVSARGHVYPLGELGSFASSDPRLDEILELCRQTMISTNLHLLVDSWSREREPYEADAYLQMRCNGVVGDDSALARYSLDYLLRRRTWPTEWPFYLVLTAWELYLHSGDETPLRQHYQALLGLLPTRWLDPNTGLVRKDEGSDGSSSKLDHDIVDWPPTERDDYRFGPVNTVVNALAFGAFRAMANIARSIDRSEDAAELAETARRLAVGMNDLLWDEQAGAYWDGLDADGNPLEHHAVHASAFAAALGVAGSSHLSAIGASIARRGMVASVYAAPFVLEALYAAGRPDDAYDLIVGDGLRSWRSMIQAGAGATMEAWSESLKANISCAHPWSASPLFVVAEHMMGIRPTSPGYRTFEVRPMPGALRTARLRLPTVAGLIGVTLRRDPAAWQVELEIPTGTSAHLVLPDGLRWTVTDLADTPVTTESLADLPPGAHVIIAIPEEQHEVTAIGSRSSTTPLPW